MLLRKSTPGSDSFGNEWKTEKSVVEVPDWQGEELLRIHDAGFSVVEPDDDEDEDKGDEAFTAEGGPAVLPDDQEHPPLAPATQSLAPRHTYGDDRDRPAGEQENHEVWDAFQDKRDEENDREAEIKGEAAHDEAIKRAVVDAEKGNQAAPQETTNADALGDGKDVNVLEPHPSTGITAADATGKTRPQGGKPRGVRNGKA